MNTVGIKNLFFLLFAAVLPYMQCGEQLCGTLDTGNAKIAEIIIHKECTVVCETLFCFIVSDYVSGISSSRLIRMS